MKPIPDLRPSLSGYLRQRLLAFQNGFRHNLALLGPWGSGKSTLMHQLLSDPSLRLTVIACPLQRDSVPGFVRRFSASVLRGALRVSRDLPLESLLQRASSAAPKTAAAVQQLERYAGGHLQAEAFVHTLDVVSVLHEELKQPCVLVLDEFLHLEDLGLSHAFHELGKRVMTWPFVQFWVTSSSTCQARQILRERLHLLFGQFELLSLGPVESAAAGAWMHRECPGLRQAPVATQFLLHWVGASPWYLSVLLKRTNELARLKRGPRLTEAVLFDAAWDVLGSPDGVLYQWCAAQVDRLVHRRDGPLAREVLIAVARGARTAQAVAQQCGTRRNLSEVLQMLADHDLIQRKGACWVMTDQLLACWLASVLGATDSRGVRDRQTAYVAFQQALQAVWVQWLEATHQPLSERVSRLLLQFRNETVSLDHKTGRLPSFETLAPQRPGRRGETYIVADGAERRWCCLVHEGTLDESDIAAFEVFCRSQSPRPSRKIVVSKTGLELNAKLLAKEANMWVWEPGDANLLFLLYGQPPLSSS